MDKDIVEVFEDKAPEILLELAKYIELTLVKKIEIEAENARQIGIEIAQTISKNWGGSVVYIPRNLIFILNERDRKIFNEFNGTNHRDLAKKYGVSMQWVYTIVKRINKEEIAKRQFNMFE
ncbi:MULTISPECIES: Mor transcription activator family protein [Pasteurella]|uniref:Transcriptional regulator n=1 Tax=Pasteurella multocida TaxID=747 RepID=A0A849CIH2_PASMD|nr:MULTISPECIES: Mor transcription activator family protein [Pasteurella]AUK44873.1 transcriptional regulator [Pasteurella multocida]AXN95113.1 transcriptional regulator [Pasteurella multocida]AXN95167.1 transcriptional regulator [Pasteurella multocida]AXN98968.1 transcriptional regulator [Pasteurella multocida]AXO01184.1 transcriptional regulator [Pasteurella multocida]